MINSTYMHYINRSLAIIKPKRPFITWANSLPDADREFSPEAFLRDCTALLINEYETKREAKAHINEIWEDIFDDELYAWSTNEAWWPLHRTQKMFWQWFEVEFHSMVYDPYADGIPSPVIEL